jgi:predicted phage baseplate assembly protein
VVDRAARALRFGDGVTGRIPVPHGQLHPQIEVSYRGGGGVDGNVARGKTWEAALGATVISALNPVAASGGADPETLEAATLRIAGNLQRNRRAVTKADYEELARTTPGVAIARALAVVGLHPLHPCVKTMSAVTVFVVAFAPRPAPLDWMWPDPTLVAAPQIDPGALVAVQHHLDQARLVTSRLFVRPAPFAAVSLRVRVTARPVDPGALGQRLGAHLSRYLDPLAGGGTGGGLPFGEPVRPSALVRIAQDKLMGEADVEDVSVSAAGGPYENCRDVAIGPYALAYLRQLEVVYRALPATGGLS